MYLPHHFAETRPEILHALIHENPLGTLITEADGSPVADEIPFVLDRTRNVLLAHLARANPLSKMHPPERRVLVVFRGPQAYVSPAWYPGKAEHGRVVPTWNYVIAQAVGQMSVVDDPAWLRAQLETITTRQESGRTAPWQVADAPEDFVAQQMKGIIGIEIAIETLTGKWKASQNRSAPDRAGVAAGLGAEATESARQMAQIIQQSPP